MMMKDKNKTEREREGEKWLDGLITRRWSCIKGGGIFDVQAPM
jgi:hypothetical protein